MPSPLRKGSLTKEEISAAFADGELKPILTPETLAQLLGLKTKTIYFWIANGRLNGAFRKRGKHILIWRDRAIDQLFNGPDWPSAV